MSNTNLLEQIPDDWNAAPPSAQALLQKLLPLADEVAELRERVALLEKGHSPVPIADNSVIWKGSHPYAEVFGSLSGPIWDEIFAEMECERQAEIAAEEAEAEKAA